MPGRIRTPGALFAYGTLEDPHLLRRLTGRAFRSIEARLPGYRCMRVKGATYPGIVADPGADTRGTLYLALDLRSLHRLDRYEGRLYRRIRLPVEDLQQRTWLAYVYVVPFPKRHRLSHRTWKRGVARDAACKGGTAG